LLSLSTSTSRSASTSSIITPTPYPTILLLRHLHIPHARSLNIYSPTRTNSSTLFYSETYSFL
jgi:hypothetical protein